MASRKKQGSIFEAIMNAAVCGIVVINEKGQIQHVNPAGAELFDYQHEELIGKNVNVLMPEPDQTQHDGYLSNYLRTGERKIIGIGRKVLGKRKDGHCFPMFLSVGHIDDEESPRFVGIIHDLTAEEDQANSAKKSREEARQLREKLHHAGRISLLGEMATGIAHEINQPLTAIATYAQACKRLLAADPENANDVIDALDKIDVQARRASKVITGIRQLSKSEAIGNQNANCVDLISEVAILAEGYASENGIRILLDTENVSSTPMVIVDPIQTQQVLLNLINNAVESMTSCSDELSYGNEIWIKANKPDDKFIEVSVVDTGPGIKEEDLEAIFDAFFTTKKTGLGIGLSICQSIIFAQGGKIYATSNGGQGTTFTITLPLSDEGSP